MVEYKQGFRRRALQCIKQKRPLLFKRSEQVATFFSETKYTRPEDDAIERIQIQMIVVHVYLYNMYIY